MQSYYEYVRARKSQGKLSEEQFEACKEGEVGGVFGYSTRIEELAKKYGIPEKDMDYILTKYGTLDNFYEMHNAEKIKDEKDKELEGKIINNVVDIDGNFNRRYNILCRAIFGINSGSIGLNLYSLEELKIALEGLTKREKSVLERKFGLIEGMIPEDFETVSRELNIQRKNVRQIEAKALRKLTHPSRRKKIIISLGIEDDGHLTEDEKYQINEIEKEIQLLNGDLSENLGRLKKIREKIKTRKEKENKGKLKQLILIGQQPIKELIGLSYEDLLDIGLDQELATKISLEIEKYKLEREEYIKRDSDLRSKEMDIEEFDFSIRTFNCLKRAGISTSGDLIKLTEEDLKKIKNLGPRGVEEVLRKIKEYEIENNTDEVQEQTGEDIMQEQRKPQTELENEAEHIESIIQDSNEQEANEQETNEQEQEANEQEPDGQMASNQESSEQYRDMTTEQLQELIARNTEKIAKNEATIKSRLIARLLEQQKIISGQEKVINALEEERAQKKEI